MWRRAPRQSAREEGTTAARAGTQDCRAEETRDQRAPRSRPWPG